MAAPSIGAGNQLTRGAERSEKFADASRESVSAPSSGPKSRTAMSP
jgi:hypothetical protein